MSKRLFLYWTKQNTLAQDEFCLREIGLSVGFSESDLSNERCIGIPDPVNTQRFSIKMFEDNNQNLSLFLDTGNVYFASQNGGIWSDLQTIFIGNGNSYYSFLNIQQYGSSNEMSLTIQHIHDYFDPDGFLIREGTLFNYLYN